MSLLSVAVTRHSDQKQHRAGNELVGLHFQVTSILRRSWAGAEVGTQRRNCRGMFLTVSLRILLSQLSYYNQELLPREWYYQQWGEHSCSPMDTSSGVPQLKLKSGDSWLYQASRWSWLEKLSPGYLLTGSGSFHLGSVWKTWSNKNFEPLCCLHFLNIWKNFVIKVNIVKIKFKRKKCKAREMEDLS